MTACEPSYPVELIAKICEVKGSAWLYNEILREEDPAAIEKNLPAHVFLYFREEGLSNRRILDFGCDSCASTAVPARLMPGATIVALETEPPRILMRLIGLRTGPR